MAQAAAATTVITTSGEKRFTTPVYDRPCEDPPISIVVDHVIVCAPDLDRAVRAFEDTHGLASVPGGRHDGHGTANRLVPLGDTYIELVAVVDSAEAGESMFGSWVATRASTEGADAVAFRTDDLEAICDRLALEPIAMSRLTGSGDELRWRLAGLDRLVSDGLPFFIQWDMDLDLHPGRIPITHPTGSMTLTDVTITGDESQLTRWLEDAEDVAIEQGEKRVDFVLSLDPREDL